MTSFRANYHCKVLSAFAYMFCKRSVNLPHKQKQKIELPMLAILKGWRKSHGWKCTVKHRIASVKKHSFLKSGRRSIKLRYYCLLLRLEAHLYYLININGLRKMLPQSGHSLSLSWRATNVLVCLFLKNLKSRPLYIYIIWHRFLIWVFGKLEKLLMLRQPS